MRLSWVISKKGDRLPQLNIAPKVEATDAESSAVQYIVVNVHTLKMSYMHPQISHFPDELLLGNMRTVDCLASRESSYLGSDVAERKSKHSEIR